MTTENIQFEGKCAFAISLGKKDVMGGHYQLTRNHKTYKFSNPVAKLLFILLPNTETRAIKHWNEITHA